MSRAKVSITLGKKADDVRARPSPRAFAFDADVDTEAPLRGDAPPPSKAVRRQQAEAAALDEHVFDYDDVYDKMKAVDRQMKAASKEADKGRSPKYMSNFFRAAELRERDRLRAESKMIQRERAAEGDQYADKESFVTSAYKEQQEELARAEKEERIAEERARRRSKGVASFHQDMLKEESARRHAAVMALQNEVAVHEAHAPEETDLSRVERAVQQGKSVELNDEHQIVDRRELLGKGLNMMKRKADNDTETAAKLAPRESGRGSDRAARSQLMEEALLARLG
ncbi:hypothetical protein MVES1_001332 [Malassezia vespertilionis]|uniref:Nuclear speckle splicing regulatory protein 1 N-terminal domain-containing protein n=1 Tax=Malassezia vespertilionis TaxID=2020962 RepID=A0A2N1JDV6_9BASI|nr:uncharacterized protein MVES1_001332 [Malassezia vespertilionis]PKI84716.1 hypothetical protein MVES_001250 [Malassezia vespertilionis]WFD05994.1 hypothetical protein MVES1_001332 [Malassezia vespertilionis]